MVNSFAHRYGYRNFEVGDHSQNNTMVAWLVMGEGYQNNHHAKPLSPRFSHQWYEIDLGYGMCIVAEKMRLLKMRKVRRTEKARFEPMEHSA
ncbi:MAG: hypothetical protein EOP09_15240 [Proteobacteria bacterium]|nr:MAG: hypothetical protein EOP09_15240 [Pseudomonadota bacterium]